MDENFKPLISIIIPVFNAQKYIKNCIESIYKQTYTNFELIVINDGSEDNSFNILTVLNETFDFKLINKFNSGVSNTRNLGIDNANGEFICFIDADDYIKEDYLENFIVNYTNKNDLIIQDILRRGKRKVNYIPGRFNLISDLDTIIIKNKLLNNGGPVAKFYCLDIIKEKKIRFSPEVTYGEDLIFLLNYIEYIESLTFLNYAGYIYNYNNNSASTKKHTFYTYYTVSESINSFIKSLKTNNKKILSNLYEYKWNFIQSTVDSSIDLSKNKLKKINNILDYKSFIFANSYFRKFIFVIVKLKLYRLLEFVFIKKH